MSYTPTNWVDGETPVNAENLNKLEKAVQDNDAAITEIGAALENVAGGSGIHIGTEAPTDPNVNAWIDTDEEALSGGGGVSSWNDLTDRPFYSEYEISTVLDETSPAFNEEEGAFDITDPISLTTGNEYTVNWNGTEYTCVCGVFEMDYMSGQYLGNAAPMGMGDDTGEPFVMLILPSEMAAEAGVFAQIMPLDGSTELTISITGMVETVTPIPEKYLPKPVFLYTDGTYLYKTPDTTDANNLLIKAELVSLIESGRTIYVRYDNDGNIGYFTPVEVVIRSTGGTITVLNTTSSVARVVFAAPNTRDI